ncbi:MAG: endonuclease III [Eubacterium sp.]|nr:endonuclease III [Eubacterium sp.]MBR6218701.1 endonuclease III [Eubacterium sp.]
MTKKERAVKVTEILNKEYGTNLHTYLHYEEPWQLLFATILSAQCTDDRVNMVTKELFKKYPDVKSFADADLDELMKDIFSTGFYRNKATNIIACAKMLLEKYDGEVPSDIDLLTALPGVGRKTANVVRGNVYNEPSIVVDTHVKRVSKLLGLTENDDPVKVEFDLMKVLPKEQWILFNIQAIAHGRKVCIARRPKCAECVLREVCKSAAKVKQ